MEEAFLHDCKSIDNWYVAGGASERAVNKNSSLGVILQEAAGESRIRV